MPLEGGYCPEEEFNFSTWTVKELKDELRPMGLPLSGKKADLVKRLEKEF